MGEHVYSRTLLLHDDDFETCGLLKVVHQKESEQTQLKVNTIPHNTYFVHLKSASLFYLFFCFNLLFIKGNTISNRALKFVQISNLAYFIKIMNFYSDISL